MMTPTSHNMQSLSLIFPPDSWEARAWEKALGLRWACVRLMWELRMGRFGSWQLPLSLFSTSIWIRQSLSHLKWLLFFISNNCHVPTLAYHSALTCHFLLVSIPSFLFLILGSWAPPFINLSNNIIQLPSFTVFKHAHPKVKYVKISIPLILSQTSPVTSMSSHLSPSMTVYRSSSNCSMQES